MAGPTDDHRVHVDHADPPPSRLRVQLLIILVQVFSGIYYVISSVALVGGMNRIVLSLYRDILTIAVLIPAAYFIDKGNRLKLSWDVILHLLLLGLTGIYGSNYLLFIGIEYTSPEVSAAIQPFIPVVTAFIAVALGIEVVHWHRRDGQLKVLGFVLSCTGAFVMAFYKGPAALKLWKGLLQGLWTPFVVSEKESSYADMRTLQLPLPGWISSWQFGGLCLLGNGLCMASFINLQPPLLRRYPAPISILAYSYAFGALCMAVTGYFAVTDVREWAIGFDTDLVVVIYNGLIASALNYGIMGWCLLRVGPVFVSSFVPLQPVIAGFLSLVFLGTTIYLGSIVGAVLVIIGLWLVSWAREETSRLASLSRHVEGHHLDPHRTTVDALKEPLIQIGH